VRTSADTGVLAFSVLADDDEVDRTRVAPSKWGLDTGKELYRSNARALVESLADCESQTPQRHMIGDRRPSAGAEKNGIEPGEGLKTVRRHHATVTFKIAAAPGKLRKGHRRQLLVNDCSKDGKGGVGDFDADTVTGDDGNGLVAERQDTSRRRSEPPAKSDARLR
jgi:hypothetical protein